MAKDPVRVAAGKKSWETRRANEEFARRSAAAKKSWETRRAREAGGDIVVHPEVDEEELEDMVEEIEEHAAVALEVIIQQAVEVARSHAPVRTGALRSSISGYVTGDTGVVTASAPYAEAQEYGSGPKPPFSGYSASGWMQFTPGTYSSPPGGAKLVSEHPGNPAVGFMAAAEDYAAEEGADILLEFL